MKCFPFYLRFPIEKNTVAERNPEMVNIPLFTDIPGPGGSLDFFHQQYPLGLPPTQDASHK